MPRLDGFEVLAQVRGRGERIPIIMLSARDEVDATVRGFEGGVDDYVTKPFRFDELLARVRARLRPAARDESDRYRYAGSVTLDVLERRVHVDGDEVALSDKEFRLADILMSHAGQVLSREQLLSRVWGYDFDPGSNVVDVYVGYLRKKLGAARIETVRGAGYRFRA
jgi:DNA-binding response OmpR family regulator